MKFTLTLRARLLEPFVDALLQLGVEPEPAESLREVHPAQAQVVLGAPELDVGRRGRGVRLEELVDQRVDAGNVLHVNAR